MGPNTAKKGTDPMIQNVVQDFCIDFDGGQVLCRTDVPEVGTFISKMFSAMLVPHADNQIGQIELLRSVGGFTLNGGESLNDEGDPSGVFDQLRHEVLMTFILARRDLIWLHAGVVKRGGGATLISGPSGAGKSTLTTILCERGWQFLSDDAAPLSVTTMDVLPYPQTPRRRVYHARELSSGDEHLLEREMRPVPAERVWRGRSPVAQIVFIEFSFDARAELRPATPGETTLGLISNCTNFVDHKADGVACLAALARSAPGYVLKYGDNAAAAALIDELAI